MKTFALVFVAVCATVAQAMSTSQLQRPLQLQNEEQNIMDLLKDESNDLQDTLDNFAKTDPIGLQVLKSGIDAALHRNSFHRSTRYVIKNPMILKKIIVNKYKNELSNCTSGNSRR